MSFQVETDAIPIPAESDDTANAISTQTNSESLNIADTPPQDQVTNDQNNDDLSNQTIQEPLTDLVLPLRPPKDFELNNFLLCLAEEIEHDDLEKMKFLLLGEEGISTRTTEQIKSPLDLFKLLKKRSIISRHDILYLQLMLKFTGKEKSIRKACDFANNTKETIHFFPPPKKPADGYKYAQLHVKVPDAQKYTRQSLENLRRRISMMTFALESDIHIVGLESQSILVTFMMPSVYAEILEDLLDRKIYSDVFQEMMVDYVVVCNRRFIFDVKDSASETNIESTETLEINKEDDESEETQHQNEESKMEYLKLLNELETIKITMKQKEKESTREIDKLQKENACLLLELEHIKQDHSEYPRKNGVKKQNGLKALKIAN